MTPSGMRLIVGLGAVVLALQEKTSDSEQECIIQYALCRCINCTQTHQKHVHCTCQLQYAELCNADTYCILKVSLHISANIHFNDMHLDMFSTQNLHISVYYLFLCASRYYCTVQIPELEIHVLGACTPLCTPVQVHFPTCYCTCVQYFGTGDLPGYKYISFIRHACTYKVCKFRFKNCKHTCTSHWCCAATAVNYS